MTFIMFVNNCMFLIVSCSAHMSGSVNKAIQYRLLYSSISTSCLHEMTAANVSKRRWTGSESKPVNLEPWQLVDPRGLPYKRPSLKTSCLSTVSHSSVRRTDKWWCLILGNENNKIKFWVILIFLQLQCIFDYGSYNGNITCLFHDFWHVSDEAILLTDRLKSAAYKKEDWFKFIFWSS